MGNGLFITGTDTGVGKTAVTAALAQYLQSTGSSIGVMKPIETGVSHDEAMSSDAHRLRNAIQSTQTLDSIRQYRFPDPVAPLAAANRQKQIINLLTIQAKYQRLEQQFEWVLVEGVGGLMVPLTKQEYVRDLIRLLKLPCLLVGQTTLGGINHLLLTLEALENWNIQVLAIIMNQCEAPIHQESRKIQMLSTMNHVRTVCKVPVFGPLVYEPECHRAWEEGIHRLQQQDSIQHLANLLMQRPT